MFYTHLQPTSTQIFKNEFQSATFLKLYYYCLTKEMHICENSDIMCINAFAILSVCIQRFLEECICAHVV